MGRLLAGISGIVGALLLSGAAAAEEQAAHPAPTSGIVDLTTVNEIKELCLATRPTSRVYFSTDPSAKPTAKADYIAARRAAMKQVYRVSVPASGFKVGEYRPKDGTLELDLSRPLRTLYGALTVSIPSSPAVKFTMPLEKVKDAQAAMRAGTATLVSYFELNDEQGAVCSGSAAAGVFSATARAVKFDLRDGMGQELGTAETALADQHRAVLGGYSGTPTVAFGAVDGDTMDAAAIAKRLGSMIEPLKACYVERLKTRVDAGGTAVLGVALLADGRVEAVNFVADALRDEPLRKCIDEYVKATKFNGVPGIPGLFRVTVDFSIAKQR